MNVFPDMPGQAWKSKKRQTWSVTAQTGASGKRRTLINQTYPKWTIEVKYVGLTKTNADIIMGFFGQQKAGFESFLFKDNEDYQVTGQYIGVGTGNSQSVYLYRSIAGEMSEPVTDIIPNTLKLYANGTQIECSIGTNGLITFTAPQGTVLTIDYQYYWRVAFDSDYNEQTIIFLDVYENASIKMVTAR